MCCRHSFCEIEHLGFSIKSPCGRKKESSQQLGDFTLLLNTSVSPVLFIPLVITKIPHIPIHMCTHISTCVQAHTCTHRHTFVRACEHTIQHTFLFLRLFWVKQALWNKQIKSRYLKSNSSTVSEICWSNRRQVRNTFEKRLRYAFLYGKIRIPYHLPLSPF